MTCTHLSRNTTDIFVLNNWRFLASKGWQISARTVNIFYTLRHNSKVRITINIYVLLNTHRLILHNSIVLLKIIQCLFRFINRGLRVKKSPSPSPLPPSPWCIHWNVPSSCSLYFIFFPPHSSLMYTNVLYCLLYRCT
jgi:hypothetical protein